MCIRDSRKYNYWNDVLNPKFFCPIDHWNSDSFLENNFPLDSLNESYAIHLWNEVWRRRNLEKDKAYPKGSLYEHLKAKYLAPIS